MPDTSDQQPVLVIMGVAGCGKSTVAALLAGQLGWDFQEGDDLHSADNVEKMASGQPLTDDDRRPWLDAVASWIREHDFAGIPGIVTCSALKRAYRDRLYGPHVVFVYLAGDHGEIRNRLSARINHYMPPALLESQLAWLEPPQRTNAQSRSASQRGPPRSPRRSSAGLGCAPNRSLRHWVHELRATRRRLLWGTNGDRLRVTAERAPTWFNMTPEGSQAEFDH